MEYRESGIEQRNFSISVGSEGERGMACSLLFSTVFPFESMCRDRLKFAWKEREREREANIFFPFLFLAGLRQKSNLYTSILEFTPRTIRSWTRDISFFMANGYACKMERRGPWNFYFRGSSFMQRTATIWPVNGYITENTVELKEKGADDNRMEIRWKLRRWPVRCCFLAKLIGRKGFDDWKIKLELKLEREE